MSKESSEKLEKIINYYKENINKTDSKIYRDYCVKKYNFYVNHTSKCNTYEYYMNNIAQEIKEKLQLYTNELHNISNKLSFETWCNSFMSFIEKSHLNKNHMLKYVCDLLEKNGFSNKYSTEKFFNMIKKDKETVSEIQVNTTELELKEQKKGKHKKNEINSLTGISILLLQTNLSSLITPIIKKIRNNLKDDQILEVLGNRYNLSIDENKSLSISTDKEMYKMIKQELFKLENKQENGIINNKYKKSKLTSKLLNNKIIINLSDKLKFKNYDKEESIDTKDIKKGLGVMK